MKFGFVGKRSEVQKADVCGGFCFGVVIAFVELVERTAELA
jgi:hypothetical protein